MNQHYQQIKGSKLSTENDKEMLLSAFGGMCYHCKTKGHKANKCSKKAGNGGNGKTGYEGQSKFKKCDNCGKPGHKANNCWSKEENKGKRPNWYKTKSNAEVAASATNSGGKKVEFLLCNITTMFSFPQTKDLLLDPNIWIADSAVTVHTTAHKQGFHLLKKPTEAVFTMMGKGIACWQIYWHDVQQKRN
jgi:hypothetical protein